MSSSKPMGIAEAVGSLLAREGLVARRPNGLMVRVNEQCSLVKVGPWKNNYARLTVKDCIAEDWWIEPAPAATRSQDEAA